VALQYKINDSIEEGMARTHKGGRGFSRRGNEVLFKHDPFITGENRFSAPDEPVAGPYRGRNAGYFIAPRFPFTHRTAQPSEGLQEE
jgi:hypothetical protein